MLYRPLKQLLLVIFILCQLSIVAQTKRNVILVITDQQQAQCSAREGFSLNTTPFMDELAMSGTWFDRGYTSSPQCVPARISLLTGRYSSATGVRNNRTNYHDRKYIRATKDIFDVAKDANYQTAYVGKNHTYLKGNEMDYWHQYTHVGYKPETEEERAFTDWMKELCHRVSPVATPFPVELQSEYKIVSDALNYVDGAKTKEEPFFMVVSFPEPHNPFQCPEPYFSMFDVDNLPAPIAGDEVLASKGFKYEYTKAHGKHGVPAYDDEINRMRANYYGMLRMIDDQIKRFVEGLQERDAWENTVLIYVSDHGEFAGNYGLIRKGPGMSESLMRIPYFIVGKDIVEDSDPSECFVSIVDVLPTVCEILEQDIPLGVQGRSLLPVVQGEDYPQKEFESIYGETGYTSRTWNWEDEEVSLEPERKGACNPFQELGSFTVSGVENMVCKGDWKLIYTQEGKGELYNLKKDIAEINNLFYNKRYDPKRSEMMELLITHKLRVEDKLPDCNQKRKENPHNWWYSIDE